jgi:hypothetical protein
MNQTWKTCIFVFTSIAGLAAIPAAAWGTPEDAASPAVEEEDTAPDALPTKLDSWGEDVRVADELLSITALPQGRLATQPPFIDFSRFMAGGFIGAVKYSSDFKAKTNFVGGLNARVPVPGLPLDHWGIWADVYAAGINRDLPFFYPNKSGTWFGGTVGLDYTFVDGEIFVFRGQAGLAYAYWNGVQSLDNGFGGTVGVDFAWYWIKHYRKATVNITPQITFSGSNYYAFISLGFQVEF